MDPDFVSVVVDADVPDLRQPFTYRVPNGMPIPPVGTAVVVPFGGNTLLGFVVPGPSDSLDAVPEIRELLDRVDAEPFFGEDEWDLARWMAERYYCSLRDVVRCIVPEAVTARVNRAVCLTPGADLDALTPAQRAVAEKIRDLGDHATLDALRSAGCRNPAPLLKRLRERGAVEERYVVRPPRIRARTRKAWTTPSGPHATLEGVTAKQRAALDLLRASATPLAQAELLEEHQIGAATLSALERKGLAVRTTLEAPRDPFPSPPPPRCDPILSPDQAAALRAIEAGFGGPGPRRFLLHGVTASGKTEVYLRALETCAAAGRTGLLLVPEISLTAQMMETVRARFGSRAAVLHSALSEGERFDEWMRIRKGDASVVVGARSAVFAPIANLALVVVDEEHETSYKQESTPRYHTRDVAARRAQLSGGVLVLGSATPSVETYHWASQGVIQLLPMPTRIDVRPMPAVRIIDLRDPSGTPRIFSEALEAALRDRLAASEQSILFLNRRGYATFVLCRDCGYTAMCPNCSVTLTYHAAARSLECHHCAHRRRAPSTCPHCSSERIRHFGLGTERLEEEVARLFPSARVIRMDPDTTRRKGSHRDLLAAFRSGAADVLIGTQMVAKGLDFPRVTLVGVVAADLALNLPDFRAAERSFQLIAQVAGRAGRGAIPGEVVVQTFNPDHYSLQAAAQHDYERFFRQEIEHRGDPALNYPPFSRLANLVVNDTDRDAARSMSCEVALAIEERARDAGAQVLGPAPAPMERIKGRYRWHVLLKAPDLPTLNRVLRPVVDGLDRKLRQCLMVDVDPVNLM